MKYSYRKSLLSKSGINSKNIQWDLHGIGLKNRNMYEGLGNREEIGKDKGDWFGTAVFSRIEKGL